MVPNYTSSAAGHKDNTQKTFRDLSENSRNAQRKLTSLSVALSALHHLLVTFCLFLFQWWAETGPEEILYQGENPFHPPSTFILECRGRQWGRSPSARSHIMPNLGVSDPPVINRHHLPDPPLSTFVSIFLTSLFTDTIIQSALLDMN